MNIVLVKAYSFHMTTTVGEFNCLSVKSFLLIHEHLMIGFYNPTQYIYIYINILSEEYHTTPMCGTKLTSNKMFIHNC